MSNDHRKVGYVVLTLLVIVLIASAGMVIAASAGSTSTATVPDAVYAPNSWLNITPGSNPSQLCFSWATNTSDVTSFVYTPVDDVQSTAQGAAALPVPEVQIVKLGRNDNSATVFAGNNAKIGMFYGVTVKTYLTTSSGTAPAGWYQNRVTVSGLADSSSYAYRVGYGASWSGIYTFHTRNPRSFSFIAMGDPQLGANTGGIPAQDSNVLGYDTAGWQNSVAAAIATVPDASFLVSLGDEVDNQSAQSGVDPQYDAYFSPLQLLGIPVATIDGNHDYALGQYYGYHYNLPNQSTQYGATQYGNDGDYWFTYGNALFMVLNSNTESAATHDVFIGQAIAANPDAKWRIVSFHHSLYSDADHTFDSDILFRRSTYPAVFDKYHIDVVLMGHDHSFTRSYQMLGGVPVSKNKMKVAKDGSISVKDPAGTLYMTLDSGSGSKYYQLNQAYINPTTGKISYPAYTANYWQENEPTFSRVTIDDNHFSIVTYATNALAKPIDDYSIVKDNGPFHF